MGAIQLFLISILVFSAGALIALVFYRSRTLSGVFGGLFGLAGSLLGIISAYVSLSSGTTPVHSLFQIPGFGTMQLEMDSLSAFLVALISLIGVATSVYSLSASAPSGLIAFLINLFVPCMLIVVTVNNGFYFLIFWELMTLVSFFLVIWETKKNETIQAGFVYMIVAHAGAALIMLAFLLLFQKSGSWAFSSFREVVLSPGMKTLLFGLFFLGFGAKAGMVPLHFWTPGAYAAAPSQASALMAGVMKKTAIYGILRVCVDLLGVTEWWWGVIVLSFGVISIVFGAFYALSERDIKRLLAYSSVENVGIILLGVGVGMVGLASGQPILVVLGFLAALYHTINHAFFKGLLFLGAGSVTEQVGTHDLNRIGGLARRMPWTSLAFLAGAMSVAAIPPLNGLVSEWFTYQALFAASREPLFALRVLSPIFAVLMAFAGAIALMVYIKAYGGIFTGPARSERAGSAREAPLSELVSMGYLVVGCLVLGLGAPMVTPWIADIVAKFTGFHTVYVARSWFIFPASATQAVLSPPIIAIMLIGLLFVPVIVIVSYRGFQAGRRKGVDPWSCGYGYSTRMSITASSFDQPVKISFRSFYWFRTLLDKPFNAISRYSRSTVGSIMKAEPVIEAVVTQPATRLVQKAGKLIQFLQMGDIRIYCLYIILTLVVLLVAVFGGSGL